MKEKENIEEESGIRTNGNSFLLLTVFSCKGLERPKALSPQDRTSSFRQRFRFVLNYTYLCFFVFILLYTPGIPTTRLHPARPLGRK